MASQVMRITLKAYDHQLVDQSAAKIVDTVKNVLIGRGGLLVVDVIHHAAKGAPGLVIFANHRFTYRVLAVGALKGPAHLEAARGCGGVCCVRIEIPPSQNGVHRFVQRVGGSL